MKNNLCKVLKIKSLKYIFALVLFLVCVLVINNTPKMYKAKQEIVSNYIGYQLPYDELPDSRKNNYDKMKISHIAIVDRKTGTEPFNNATQSDSNGNDIKDTDDYVRTFDVIKYTIEVGIDCNAEDSNVCTAVNGGVIKVQAKLQNQGTPILMRWTTDSWMQNSSISDDGTTIYAEFIANEDKNLIGALQQLTFTVKVDGYKKEITEDMLPIFEVWMEGNKPDNDESIVDSVSIKSTSNIIISGKPTLDANISLSSNYIVENSRK